MTNEILTKFIKKTKSSLVKHTPEILTGFGIAGMITSTVLAVKATPKAMHLIEEAKYKKIDAQVENGVDRNEIVDTLTPKEVIKETWKCYIPAAATTVASIGCLISANAVHLRRNAALAAAYKLSETALIEYKDKVVEALGEEKAQEVRDKIAEAKVEKAKETTAESREVIETSHGRMLFMDSISGRTFRSDIEAVKKVANDLSRDMLSDMYVSLNQFYERLDLPHIKIGYDIGWNVDYGLIEPEFGSCIFDGEPCVVLDFRIPPRYGYDRIA